MSDQPTPHEHEKCVYEQVRNEERRAHDRFAEFHLALSESAIKSSELTLRTAVIINGGAAISVLAFIAAQGRIGVSQLGGIADCLILFALGVASATAGMCFSYLTHYFTFAGQESNKLSGEPPFVQSGPTMKWWKLSARVVYDLAILACLASLILFVMGMFDVKDAITVFSNDRGLNIPTTNTSHLAIGC
jgi:hypothetical protein